MIRLSSNSSGFINKGDDEIYQFELNNKTRDSQVTLVYSEPGKIPNKKSPKN